MAMGLALAAMAAHAQLPAAGAVPVAMPAQKAVQAQVPEEGIGSMGRRLWTEVRRRLNLTSEAEQARPAPPSAPVSMQLGSVKVRFGAPSQPAKAPPATKKP
jgi:hypothetical protein